MERTYNVFVDNGLFVLGYYLNKSIKDITFEDIENSIDMMNINMFKLTSCKKHFGLRNNMLFNSPISNPSIKEKEIAFNKKMKDIIKNKGKDTCFLCGKNNSNVLNEINRSLYPNIVANTFYNYSNNLKGVNICPHCALLSIYSMLNVKKEGSNLFLYNSDIDDFLIDYTKEMQNEKITDSILCSGESKMSTTELLKDLLNNSKWYIDGYIEQYIFNNPGQGTQKIKVININNKLLKLISKLDSESLLDEFNSLGLMYNLIYNNLETTYIYKIADIDNLEIKCTKRLLDFLNREVNSLSEEVIKIIEALAEKIKQDLNSEKTIKELKNMIKFQDFEGLLVRLSEDYNLKTGEKLITSSEYVLLDNIRKYKQIKNLLIINLI